MTTRRQFLGGLVAGTTLLLGNIAKAEGSSYLRPDEHQEILKNPEAIRAIYQKNKHRFIADLGVPFADMPGELFRLAFASVVAYDLKPYGPCRVIELRQMLDSPEWDCDNYVAATWHFFNFLVRDKKSKIIAVGWDKGPIGNHAQMMARVGDHRLLVDPTIGLVQYGCGFDWVASGKACSAETRKEFIWRDDPDIRSFHDRVVSAVENGEYRPSHLLYVFDDLKEFSFPSPMASWPTPATITR